MQLFLPRRHDPAAGHADGVAAKPHTHRERLPAGGAAALESVVGQEGCARQIAGVLQQGKEEKEDRRRRQHRRPRHAPWSHRRRSGSAHPPSQRRPRCEQARRSTLCSRSKPSFAASRRRRCCRSSVSQNRHEQQSRKDEAGRCISPSGAGLSSPALCPAVCALPETICAASRRAHDDRSPQASALPVCADGRVTKSSVTSRIALPQTAHILRVSGACADDRYAEQRPAGRADPAGGRAQPLRPSD